MLIIRVFKDNPLTETLRFDIAPGKTNFYLTIELERPHSPYVTIHLEDKTERFEIDVLFKPLCNDVFKSLLSDKNVTILALNDTYALFGTQDTSEIEMEQQQVEDALKDLARGVGYQSVMRINRYKLTITKMEDN